MKGRRSRSELTKNKAINLYAISENVRWLRQAHGISARQLASRMKKFGPCSENIVSLLESKRRINPSVHTMCLLALALEVPIQALIEGVFNGSQGEYMRKSEV